MASYQEISVLALSRLVGTPTCPKILDVRVKEDFAADPHLVPSAVRHPHDQIEDLVPALADCPVVVYCQKGLKISQGAAAILRASGVRAEVLTGGHVAWRQAKQPMVASEKIPPRDSQGRSVWVTRQRPKIDRIACPWLIRRFVDPEAQFLFVPAAEVSNVADRFGATAFDMAHAFWSHRGPMCTFDTLIDEFGLGHEPLDQLATIVRGADTNRPDLASETAGLLAVSLGLSRMFRDDQAQLDAGLLIYDAFYRWARDAREESHDWPPGRAKPQTQARQNDH